MLRNDTHVSSYIQQTNHLVGLVRELLSHQEKQMLLALVPLPAPHFQLSFTLQLHTNTLPWWTSGPLTSDSNSKQSYHIHVNGSNATMLQSLQSKTKIITFLLSEKQRGNGERPRLVISPAQLYNSAPRKHSVCVRQSGLTGGHLHTRCRSSGTLPCHYCYTENCLKGV